MRPFIQRVPSGAVMIIVTKKETSHRLQAFVFAANDSRKCHRFGCEQTQRDHHAMSSETGSYHAAEEIVKVNFKRLITKVF